MTDQVKRVYAFGKDANGKNVTEGNTNMKAILGGKGANLAEMANIIVKILKLVLVRRSAILKILCWFLFAPAHQCLCQA